MPEFETQPPADASNSYYLLLISLFLILLCTFILLNSYSEVEHGKAQYVVDSLRGSFSGKYAVAPEAYKKGDTAEKSGEQEMLPALQDYLQKAYPSALRKERIKPNALVLSFPQGALFRGDTAQFTQGAEEALKEIAKTLREGDGGVFYTLHFTLDVPQFDERLANADAPELKRLGAVARFLEAEAIPARSLYAGYAISKSAAMHFEFRGN